MNVTLFGATGMVGAGALQECLADPRVESILVVVRTATGRTHPKIREVLLPDFFDYTTLQTAFASCDACFFCLGVSAIGMSEVAYSHLTYDLTVAAATTMVAANPKMTFCYISGVGTDSTEHGRTMWARVKGKTENALLALPFKAAFMFRPAIFSQSKASARKRDGTKSSITYLRLHTRCYAASFPGRSPLPPASDAPSSEWQRRDTQSRFCTLATSTCLPIRVKDQPANRQSAPIARY